MKKLFIVHPFLFAVFPVIFLYAENIDYFSFNEIIIPGLVIICITLLLFFLLSAILKNMRKAGLLVSLFLFLFFSYGHFRDIMIMAHINVIITTNFYIGPNIILFPIWTILLFVGTYYSIRTKSDLHVLTNLLNIIFGSLVVMSLFNIGIHKIKAKAAWDKYRQRDQVESEIKGHKEMKSAPHIFYIILDGYGRADILREIYNLNNREFLDFLTQKGFYVASNSHCNYCQTMLSFASSLNYQYLDDVVKRIDVESNNREILNKIIQGNKVLQFLKNEGYLFTNLSTGYGPSEFRDADIFMIPGSSRSVGQFTYALLHTTPVPNILFQLMVMDNSDYTLHRKNILFNFDHIPDMAEYKTPVFLFAHIRAPHPPFVFGENGEEVYPDRPYNPGDASHFYEAGGTVEEYISGYRNQLKYVNKKLKEMIDAIFIKSPVKPIIILQADHGPGSALDWENIENTNLIERFSILNAFYIPGCDYSKLNNHITPVNTFRLILKDIFGCEMELVENRCYFSTWLHPYQFVDVSEQVDSN